MIIEIDDDYKDIIVLSILKADKEFIQSVVEKNDYMIEEDRHYDERLLAALNVVIHNYDTAPFN